MKHKTAVYEIIVFSLILFFGIIPPFFTARVDAQIVLFTWEFPYRQLGLCLFAVVLFILSRELNTKKGFFYPSLFALTFLFFVALLFKYFTKNTLEDFKTPLPASSLQWLFCVLTFLFSAVYEEIIYRFYFSDALYRLLNYTPLAGKKGLLIVCELFGLLAFAFAHFYLGIFSVINAAIAHYVLCFLYKKTNFIWNCVLVHFLYNIISLILL